MKALYSRCIDGGGVDFPEGCPVFSADVPPQVRQALTDFRYAIPVGRSIVETAELNRMSAKFSAGAFESGPEAFFIRVDRAGCFYEVQTFLQKISVEGMHAFRLCQSPRGERGLKLYLPAPTEEGFPGFQTHYRFGRTVQIQLRHAGA